MLYGRRPREKARQKATRSAVEPKMHVLLLTPSWSVHSQRFIRMLLEKGVKVTLLDAQNPLDSSPDGYRFIRYVPVRGLRFLGKWLGKYFELSIRVTQLIYVWYRFKPDLVNVQWVDDRAWFCAKANLHPLVLSCWGSDINNVFWNEYENVLDPNHLRYALSKANYITADSLEVLDRCEQLVGHKLPTNLYFFGIDAQQFGKVYDREAQALRQKLGIPTNCHVILSSRRLNPMMGQFHILQAFAAVVIDPNMPEAVLVFKKYLSISPEFERELAHRAQELGVAQKVYWLEESEYAEIPIQYAMADIVVNYPQQDAFPVSLFEATASKRPVISANLRAYEGLFDDSILMVPPGEPISLTQAIKSCLVEEPQQRKTRVEQAFAKSTILGDQNKNLDQLLEAFESLTSIDKAARLACDPT